MMVAVVVVPVIAISVPGGSVSAFPVTASVLPVAVSRRVIAKAATVGHRDSTPSSRTCIRTRTN